MKFELTSENFESEVLQNDEPVLVDFFAVWCGPCMMLMPIIEDIADADVGVAVGRVNIDDDPELTEKYGVMSVPTLMLFKNGEPIGRLTGYHSEDEIMNFIRSCGVEGE